MGNLICFPPLLIISSSNMPPLDMTIDSWPFSINALEKSLVPSILEMETNGIMLNTKYLQSLSSEFEKKINILQLPKVNLRVVLVWVV